MFGSVVNEIPFSQETFFWRRDASDSVVNYNGVRKSRHGHPQLVKRNPLSASRSAKDSLSEVFQAKMT